MKIPKYRKGKLPENKIMLLNMLGLSWNPHKQQWDNMYRQLLDILLKELIVESGGPQPSAFTRRASN